MKKKRFARTVVFPVVGEAEQQAYASRRGSRDERIERDQEPLVVLPGRRLKGALLLPPLVLKRPHSEYVEVELLRRFKHLLDPVVLVAALVRAAGVHQVVAVRAGDVERRAVARVDEPTALRGDDARRGSDRRGGTERASGGDLADGNEEREKKMAEEFAQRREEARRKFMMMMTEGNCSQKRIMIPFNTNKTALSNFFFLPAVPR